MHARAPVLEIRNVTRRFADAVALDGLSLAVHAGEIVCLVGRSGCGKSTLLRVIAGIERPNSGEILLAGEVVSGPSRHVEPEERSIGFMFQDYALFPHLSVTDNILFGLRKLERSQAKARCEAIIARLGINHLAKRFPHMLSGGEQQRVALARALAPQPKILLMDEPFSNLDRELRDQMRAETLGLLRELGTTVIMVTHDPEEALSAGDTVALMRGGRIEQVGTGAALYDRPISPFAADFFCTFNKLPGRAENGSVDTPFGRFAAPGAGDGEAVQVFIRPQDLVVHEAGHGVAARVVCSTIMGEIEQVDVVAPARDEPLRVRSTRRHGLSPNDEIGLSVSATRVLVFRHA